jgi:hypothetical protein
LLNILCGKQSLPCNARCADPDTNFHRILLQEGGSSPCAAFFICWRVARSLLRCQRRLIRCACVSGKCSSWASSTVYSGGVSVRKYPISLKQCRILWRAA